MTQVSPDNWRGEFTTTALGLHRFQVEAWVDVFGSWRSELERKVAGGQRDLDSELEEGAVLLEGAAPALRAPDRRIVGEAAAHLRSEAPAAERAEIADAAGLAAAMGRLPTRSERVRGDLLEVDVDRERARVGAWYELFPRSFGGLEGVERVIPKIADLGFDVLYLPPIHPIGVTHRKGRNNAPTAEAGEPGSPWAIGGPEGGHTAVNPELGTMADLERLVATARTHGVEIALDFAIQCSPDHPWLHRAPRVVPPPARRHPEVRREPAQEVPGHLQRQLRKRGLARPLEGAARRAGLLGRARRADLPRGQPPHQADRLLGVADPHGPRRAPRRRLPRRGLHQPGADARPRQGRLQPVLHLLHLEELGGRARGVRRGAGRGRGGVLPAELLRQHPRHPPRIPPGGRARGLRGAPGPGGHALAELRHLLGFREPRGDSGRTRAARSTWTRRSTRPRSAASTARCCRWCGG